MNFIFRFVNYPLTQPGKDFVSTSNDLEFVLGPLRKNLKVHSFPRKRTVTCSSISVSAQSTIANLTLKLPAKFYVLPEVDKASSQSSWFYWQDLHFQCRASCSRRTVYQKSNEPSLHSQMEGTVKCPRWGWFFVDLNHLLSRFLLAILLLLRILQPKNTRFHSFIQNYNEIFYF